MKIALFHNSYQIRGGEDSMFELEARALRALGHEVLEYHVDNASSIGNADLRSKIKTALQAPHSNESRSSIEQFIATHTPDISHVHNWFPIISPSIFEAHANRKTPIVQTLHNYRLGCASANFRRSGSDCSLCRPGANTAALRHKCYRGSLAGSLTWKRVMDRGWREGTFTQQVDAYLCPSQIVYKRHKDMGLPESKLRIVPNACPDPLSDKAAQTTSNSRFEVVFAARLVPEKGTHILIQAWTMIAANLRKKAHLTIIGDGPERPQLESLATGIESIRFMGECSHAETLSHFRQSDLLVCPTLWAEPFGLTVIEAMGAGIPVIASNIGGPAELIDNENNGLLVPPADALEFSKAIAICIQAPERAKQMGKHARRVFEECYTEQAHAEALTHTFKEIIHQRIDV